MDNFKTVGERAEAVDGGDEDVGVDVIQELVRSAALWATRGC